MTFIPHLNPATLPINSHSTLLPPTDTTSSGLGTLQLCEASKACDSGDTPASGYSWNSSVYFQTMIRDKILTRASWVRTSCCARSSAWSDS